MLYHTNRAGIASIAIGLSTVASLCGPRAREIPASEACDENAKLVETNTKADIQAQRSPFASIGIRAHEVVVDAQVGSALDKVLSCYDGKPWRNGGEPTLTLRLDGFINQALIAAPVVTRPEELPDLAKVVADLSCRSGITVTTEQKLFAMIEKHPANAEYYFQCLRELHAQHATGVTSTLLLLALQGSNEKLATSARKLLAEGRNDVDLWLTQRRNQQYEVSSAIRNAWNCDLTLVLTQRDELSRLECERLPDLALKLQGVYEQIEQVKKELCNAVAEADRKIAEAEKIAREARTLYHKVNFVTVALKIADVKNAGTNATFRLEFQQDGQRVGLELPNQKGNDAERGSTTVYFRLGLPAAFSADRAFTVVLSHDNSGDKPGCRVERLSLTLHTVGAGDIERSYPIDAWLEKGALSVSANDTGVASR